VDNARKLIGKTIDVVVTSVLQTTAGKMIFGRFIEAGAAAQAQALGTNAGATVPGPAAAPAAGSQATAQAGSDEAPRKPRIVPQA
jgi:hypothetical protein